MNQTETTRKFADRLGALIAKDHEEAKKKGEDSTLEGTGQRIGVRRSSLSKYQNDLAEAGINNAAKIAKYFGVSIDYLCGLHKGKTPEINKLIKKIPLSSDTVEKLEEWGNCIKAAKDSEDGTLQALAYQDRRRLNVINFIIEHSIILDRLCDCLYDNTGRPMVKAAGKAYCEEIGRNICDEGIEREMAEIMHDGDLIRLQNVIQNAREEFNSRKEFKLGKDEK